MRVGAFVIFVLLLAFSRAPAQTPTADAVLNALDSTWERDPDAALEALAELRRDSSPSDSLRTIRNDQITGRILRTKGDYVEAIRCWKRVHDYATRHRDSVMLVEAADQIGIMNTFMGNLLEGQQYLLQVAHIYDRIGTDKDRADALNGLAILNDDLEQEEQAIELYRRALEIYERIDDTLGRANVHANLGLLYLDREEYDESELHLLKQGRLDTLLETDYGLAFHYDFLAFLRQKQGRPKDALPLAMRGLKLRDSLPSHYNRAESYNSVAGILLDLGRYEEAIAYAERVLAFRRMHQSLSQESTALETLSDAYAGRGDHATALAYHRQFYEISDSIYRRDHLSEIANKNALYEKEKQDREIAELARQQVINAAEIARKGTALMVVGLGLGAISFFAVAIWLLFRKIKKQNAVLAHLHDQKDLLLREIHHRVKNNLQTVSSLLSLQSEYIDDPAALDAIEMGRQRVRSMAIIHQRMYLQDATTPKVNARGYLEQLLRELIDTLNVRNLPLQLDRRLENIDLDVDRLIPLGLIANEVITNALKHAFRYRDSGRLRVEFTRFRDELILRIADNGSGIRPGGMDGTETFGSLLIHTFAEQLNGTLHIRGEGGTEVVLRFPV